MACIAFTNTYTRFSWLCFWIFLHFLYFPEDFHQLSASISNSDDSRRQPQLLNFTPYIHTRTYVFYINIHVHIMLYVCVCSCSTGCAITAGSLFVFLRFSLPQRPAWLVPLLWFSNFFSAAISFDRVFIYTNASSLPHVSVLVFVAIFVLSCFNYHGNLILVLVFFKSFIVFSCLF